jgi:tellurite resistance protein TehA-like permease
MATGIVSLAARGAGLGFLADVLLGLTAATYLALLGHHGLRAARRPRAVLGELRTSAIFDYLTFVAAGALLGGGLLVAGAGRAPAWALLAISALAWLAITTTILVELVVLRTLHPRSQAQGGWLLAVVAPQALGVLCLALARGRRDESLVSVAFALWLLGTALYPPLAFERIARLRSGGRPAARLRADDWILMGALAISTLAGSLLLAHLARGRPLTGLRPPALILVTGQFALAWALVPVLLWGELRHAATPPAARAPGGSRWATVFPLGMLSVATRAFAGPAGLPVLRHLGDACFAVAFAAWLLAASFAAVHRATDLRSRSRKPRPGA